MDYFLTARPAYPWSVYPVGLPALGLVAAGLVALTAWAYLRHPQASPRRVLAILALRLLALAVALLTAVRPSVGIQDDPKLPSTLLIGIDLSESMTVRDEIDNRTRIDAVRRTLDRCKPALDQLRDEKNVQTVFYPIGSPTFDPNANPYDPAAPADGKRSDYGTYLARGFDRWQAERFVRGHLLIGDGIDNGTATSALTEAGRWRAVAPVHTFAVGKSSTLTDSKDVAVVAASADPSPVPIKNKFNLKVVLNAAGFVGAKVPVIVRFDGKQVAKEEATLTAATGSEAVIPLTAPDLPGEVKVTVEVPIDSVPGDVAPPNNTLETYLTVTKEGVRVLLVDRLSEEAADLRRVLRTERRFDLAEVIRQTDGPPDPALRAAFDFTAQRYDVVILSNISARQLRAIDPRLPEQLREQVLTKGMGLLMTGGDASFAGNPDRPLDDGWRGSAVEDILPVSLTKFPAVEERLFRGADNRFQAVPTLDGLKYLMKVAPTDDAARQQWDRLNGANPALRMTAVSKLGEPKTGATVFAVARTGSTVVPAGTLRGGEAQAPYLLVGWERGDGGSKGRVLAFAGFDSRLWRPLGLREKPPVRAGLEMHAQFWRRLVLWLAHQDEDDGQAQVRPEFRRLPVQGKQTIRVKLNQPGGAAAVNPQFDVKVVAPGQKPEEATVRPWVPDADGGRVAFDPPVPGEYVVTLTATGTDAAGKPIKADASARFLAYPDVSDELVRVATEDDFLRQLASAGGGRAYRLDDLPGFLAELATQPMTDLRSKPRYVPDWRREQGKGFLTGWLVLFVALIGAEWGLRRWWGLA